MPKMTTADYRKILHSKFPPQGEDDPQTVFFSIFLDMAKRLDRIEKAMDFVARRLADLTAAAAPAAAEQEAPAGDEEEDAGGAIPRPDVQGRVVNTMPNPAPAPPPAPPPAPAPNNGKTAPKGPST